MILGNTAVEYPASLGMLVPVVAAGIGVAIIRVVSMESVLVAGVVVGVNLLRAGAVRASVRVLILAALGAYNITTGNASSAVGVPYAADIYIIGISPTASDRVDISALNSCGSVRGSRLRAYAVVAGLGVSMLIVSATG